MDTPRIEKLNILKKGGQPRGEELSYTGSQRGRYPYFCWDEGVLLGPIYVTSYPVPTRPFSLLCPWCKCSAYCDLDVNVPPTVSLLYMFSLLCPYYVCSAYCVLDVNVQTTVLCPWCTCSNYYVFVLYVQTTVSLLYKFRLLCLWCICSACCVLGILFQTIESLHSPSGYWALGIHFQTVLVFTFRLSWYSLFRLLSPFRLTVFLIFNAWLLFPWYSLAF